MKLDTVKLGSLEMDDANPRLHSKKNIEALKDSLKRFGQQKPVVVLPGGKVIAGNGTVAAARALGWKEIQVVRTELNKNEAVAYAIADNRTAELAEWDYGTLAGHLRDLKGLEVDISTLGFKDYEIGPLLQSDWKTPGEKEDKPPKDKKVVSFTLEEFKTVMQAVERMWARKGGDDIGVAGALVVISAEWLEQNERSEGEGT